MERCGSGSLAQTTGSCVCGAMSCVSRSRGKNHMRRAAPPRIGPLVDIDGLADRVRAGETVTCPSVEATGDLLTELKARGRVRLRSEWRGNRLLIVVGPSEIERNDECNRQS